MIHRPSSVFLNPDFSCCSERSTYILSLLFRDLSGRIFFQNEKPVLILPHFSKRKLLCQNRLVRVRKQKGKMFCQRSRKCRPVGRRSRSDSDVCTVNETPTRQEKPRCLCLEQEGLGHVESSTRSIMCSLLLLVTRQTQKRWRKGAKVLRTISFSSSDPCVDAVLLPPSALHRLTQMDIVYPMLFEVTNARTQRSIHCGVLEFIAEEGICYMPHWVLQFFQFWVVWFI